MRCAACGADKVAAEFSKNQRKRAVPDRKCTGCTANASTAAGNALPPPPSLSATADGGAPGADSANAQPAPLAGDGNTTASPDPTPPAPPAPTVCSWAACGMPLVGEAHNHRCGRCRREHYCSRACQKKHWKEGGHKHVCEEPPCCNICLEGGDEPPPIQRGCGCRGDAGLAHLACVAKMCSIHKRSEHQDAEAWASSWGTCTICRQQYHGEMLVGLARELLRLTPRRRRYDPEYAQASETLGDALRTSGMYAEAEVVLREAVTVVDEIVAKINEANHGEDGNFRAAWRLRSIFSCVLARVDKCAEAEALFDKTIAAQTRTLGENDPDTITSRSGLAVMLSNTGRHSEAEHLFRKVLAFHTKRGANRGVDIPIAAMHTATTYGGVLVNLGRLAEAEELLLETLAVQQRVLGHGHRLTRVTRDNLGKVDMLLESRRAEKEAQLRAVQLDSALEVLAKVKLEFGADHPNTIRVQNNVAGAFGHQGNFVEAAVMLEEVVEASKRVLGEDHPDTLIFARNLAETRRHASCAVAREAET